MKSEEKVFIDPSPVTPRTLGVDQMVKLVGGDLAPGIVGGLVAIPGVVIWATACGEALALGVACGICTVTK